MGFGHTSVYRLIRAIKRLLEVYFYGGGPAPSVPITEQRIPKTWRNDQLIARYRDGETLEELATSFGISIARVHQVILRWSVG
jgi:Mor family transcriptional regulator